MTGEAPLRRMRWWDVAQVAALEAQVFPDDPWSAEQLWSELAGVPVSRHYLVGVDAETVIGYAGLLAGPDAAEVQTLAVAPPARRRGLGRRLLRALLDEAGVRGYREVLLEVRADDPAAQSLYASEGFERIGVRRGYYRGGRVDALVMRRRARRVAAGRMPG